MNVIDTNNPKEVIWLDKDLFEPTGDREYRVQLVGRSDEETKELRHHIVNLADLVHVFSFNKYFSAIFKEEDGFRKSPIEIDVFPCEGTNINFCSPNIQKCQEFTVYFEKGYVHVASENGHVRYNIYGNAPVKS